MKQQVALTARDALDPCGGVAELIVNAVCSKTESQELEIRRSGNKQVHLGAKGWQDGVHRFEATFVAGQDGVTVYRLGPSIVDQMSYGSVVEILFPALNIYGRVSWPDVPPRILTGTDGAPEEVPGIDDVPGRPIDAAATGQHVGNQMQKVPTVYRVYQAGFYITLPLLLLATALIGLPGMQKGSTDDIDDNRVSTELRDVNRMVDVLETVLLEPQPNESPLGERYEDDYLAEDFFRRGEAYVHPTTRAELEEAIYWNKAAARLGHHDALMRLGGLMMGETGAAGSSDVVGGLTVLALGGLLAARPIELPQGPDRGSLAASSQLSRWIYKSTDNADTGYTLYRWLSDAANAEELLAP